MPEYNVRWEIEIYADSAKQAAKEALKIQRDPKSIALVFEVGAVDSLGVKQRKTIDLLKHVKKQEIPHDSITIIPDML